MEKEIFVKALSFGFITIGQSSKIAIRQSRRYCGFVFEIEWLLAPTYSAPLRANITVSKSLIDVEP